ncbi:MAG: aminodeoxyfutalosine synthase [bacterium]|nr:MAG: aminodeoxyfutalosine synthase [bacterium]
MEKIFKAIRRKVEAGQRLSFEDGVFLMNSTDLLGVGALADIVRRRKNGGNAYYIINRHINHTNVCVNQCRFCAFRKEEGESGAYAMTLDDVAQKADECYSDDISEFHVVGGLHPELPYGYYRDIIENLSRKYPKVHLQAFTAVEIDHFSKISGMSVEKTLNNLKSAGLGSLPGGGAEIFDEKIRQKICPNKVSAQRWLEVMETAHRLGIRSNATMLYGHIEKPEHRIDHLIRLRNLQDKTGGFMSFIPLAFHPLNTDFADRDYYTTGQMDIRMLAVSRLMLDNFDHIKAFWIMISPAVSQLSLHFGVDDIDGTVIEEKITNSAGAQSGQLITVDKLERMIREAGRIPVRRDTLYNAVKENPPPTAASIAAKTRIAVQTA